MANLNVAVVLTGQDVSASSVLTQVTASLGGMADMAAGAVAVAMGGILRDALEAAANAIKDFVAAAAQAEVQQAGLVALLNSTNQMAGLNQTAVNAMAMTYRDLAGGSDEAVVGIEEIGLRSGEITSSTMPQFIKVVTDLGTVLGSATTAATLLARAQDDPVGAFTRLERVTGVYDLALKANIATMVKQGDTAGAVAAIMNYVAQTTGGAAAAAADTLSGKWSILTNHLEDFGKELSGPVVAALENLLTKFIPVMDGVAGKAEETFLPLITNMAAWGQAMVEVLADGMQSAIGLVVEVVNEIGSVIASLMSPGSPPKFLPNLDKWGEAAVNVYMGGWANFDRSVFDVIYKAIKGGLPSEEIKEYADATTALSLAQDQLNAVTQHYDDLLNPLNAQLAAINFQQEKLKDATDIAKLQAILTDTGYSEGDKAAAQLQIQAIQTKEKIDGLTLEKKTAVDAEKEKVDAAQKTVDALKANIDLQLQFTNSSISSANAHAAALKGLGAAAAGLKDQFGGVGGAADGMKAKIDSAMNQMKEDIAEKAAMIHAGILLWLSSLQNDFAKNFAPGGIFAPVGAALTLVRGLWDQHHTQVTTAIQVWWANTTLYFIGHFAYLRDVVVQPALAGIKLYWQQHNDAITTINTAFWDTVIRNASTNFAFLQLVWGMGQSALKTLFDIWWPVMVTEWNDFWNLVGLALTTAADAINQDWHGMWQSIVEMGAAAGNMVIDVINGVMQGMLSSIASGVNAAIDLLNKIPGSHIPHVGGASWSPIGRIAAPSLPVPAPIPPWHNLGQTAGAANGFNGIIPPGFPNDTFLMGLTSGEHVTVTPAGQAGGQASITINIDARGSTLSRDQIKTAVKEGLQAAGIRSDQLVRMGIH